MGMFDYLRCEYKLPVKDSNSILFQTKDTPNQFMDEYLIDENGDLYEEEYDIEDRSDKTKGPFGAMLGCMTRVNIRKVKSDYTGEIRFYGFKDDINHKGWIEYSAYFESGKIKNLNLMENRDDQTP